MQHRILTLRTITPLHVGTGQSVGTTDLPIAREKTTGWPVVPGSGVKGALKEAAREQHLVKKDVAVRKNCHGEDADKALAYLFGSPDSKNAAAGALAITDLRCLLFPVRSLAGTFAYTTSMSVIEHANQLLLAAGATEIPKPGSPAQGGALLPNGTVLKVGSVNKVILEDLDLIPADIPADKDPSMRIAELTDIGVGDLRKRLVVLPDDVFSYLTKTATEVTTHVTLDFETRTAAGKMLRSEERVPSEAVFVGLLMVDALHHAGKLNDVNLHLNGLNGTYCLFGGKGSVGNGLCRVGVTS